MGADLPDADRRPRHRKRYLRLGPLTWALLLVASLVVAACSDQPSPTGRDGSPAGDTARAASAVPTLRPPAEPTANTVAEDIRSVEIPRDMVDGAKVGRGDAPIKLTMFEDFQCRFCLRFTAEDEPTLINEYVKTGKLQIEFRHFPVLGRESVSAAIASECAAGQDLFWEFHKELFAKQADEGQVSDEQINVGRFSDDALRELAGKAGVDRAAFDACLASGDHVDTVDEDEAAARSAGLSGTPNFLISVGGSSPQPLPPRGGDPVGPVQWRAIMDQLLATLERTPSPVP